MGNKCGAEQTSNFTENNNNNELCLQKELEEIHKEFQESESIAQNLITEHPEIIDILTSREDLRKITDYDCPQSNNEIENNLGTQGAENHKKIDKIIGTQPQQKILVSNFKTQRIFRHTAMDLQDFEDVFEDSGQSFQQRYREIRVFGRKSDKDEMIGFAEDKTNLSSTNHKETEKQYERLYNSMESEGNYEGSDEENFKTKEKLIANLFSPEVSSKKGGQLNNAEDITCNNRSSQKIQRLVSQTKLTINVPGQRQELSKTPTKHATMAVTAMPSYAVPGGIFQGQMKDTKRNGIGQQTFLDGTVFIGEWIGDKRSGKGIQIWPDNTLYEGQWKDDVIEGIGKIEYGNGSFYIGEWKNNKFHGKGRFQHFSGSFYEGSWWQDTQHGKGIEVQIYPHYSRYEGQFMKGKKFGKGRLQMESGLEYRGDFLDNSVHGMGVYRWSTGVIYEGHWENNKMCGSGKMIWPSGIVYQGEFSNDQKCGVGVLDYGDGSKYVGEWSHDKQDGKGTFYFKNSQAQLKGIWVYGKLITVISLVIPKGNTTNNNVALRNNYQIGNNTFNMNVPVNMLKSTNVLQQTDLGKIFLAIPDSNRQLGNQQISQRNNKNNNMTEGEDRNATSIDDKIIQKDPKNNKNIHEESAFKKNVSQFRYALSLQTD